MTLTNQKTVLALHRRRLYFLLALVGLLFVSLLLDLWVGPADIGFIDIFKGMIQPDEMNVRHKIILWDVRLPDALMALVVGIALGVSGLETQTILNNPLASPFTLGVSSFAAFGASIAIVFSPAISFIPEAVLQSTLALVFALVCGGIVLTVSQFINNARETIVLFGIALFFLGEALTSALQFVASADAIQQIVFWTVGNLTKSGWTEVIVLTVVLVLVLPFSFRRMWVLTLLRAGEDQAVSLGLNMSRVRMGALIRVSILCGFAVCFVGAIGFVGLIGPHMARLVVGEDHRYLIPGAALCGALMLSVSSVLSKVVISGAVIPVGIVTAIVGVPIFILLIIRKVRAI